ncbi:MAG: AI-2E family transporter [Pseudomonadota bacterium]
MALPVETQIKYWTIAAAVLGFILWSLGDTLLPFVLGGAIAYCMDPIADWFERWGCSRLVATVLVTLSAFLVFILAIGAFVPTLVQQTSALIAAAPAIVANVADILRDTFPQQFGQSTMEQSLQSVVTFLQDRGGELAKGLLASVNSIVNVLVLVVIVPVVAFYLLMDWDKMVARIDDLLPRDHAPKIRVIAREIDRTLASFIRGQGTVCLILGTFYAVGLMTVGLQFGLVVGFIAGLISFIPYIGSIFGGAMAIGLALFQWWGAVEVVDGDTVTYTTNWTRITIVAAIFMIGQALEGNVLTPNLVGNSVGLHPVWLIFALSVFGSLFGFVGLLVAVPVAAMIGVLVRFATMGYKSGRLYRGIDTGDDGPA